MNDLETCVTISINDYLLDKMIKCVGSDKEDKIDQFVSKAIEYFIDKKENIANCNR